MNRAQSTSLHAGFEIARVRFLNSANTVTLPCAAAEIIASAPAIIEATDFLTVSSLSLCLFDAHGECSAQGGKFLKRAGDHAYVHHVAAGPLLAVEEDGEIGAVRREADVAVLPAAPHLVPVEREVARADDADEKTEQIRRGARGNGDGSLVRRMQRQRGERQRIRPVRSKRSERQHGA